MRITKLAAICAAFLILGGCSASYQKTDTSGTASAAVHLDPTKSVLVAVPADGSFETKKYPGSGSEVAHQTAIAFAKHARKVDIAAAELHDRDALLDAARKADAGYLALPTIDHWEHRNTTWSNIPSRASVAMQIIDVPTGETLTSSLLESRSRMAMAIGGTSPERLLPHLLGDYVDGLYRP